MEGFGGTFNPRLGLIWEPWKGAAWKVLYGEAFRAPNSYERNYYDAQSGLPEVGPEKVHTYEVKFDQYFARQYRAGVSLYHMDVNDLISLYDLGEDTGSLGVDFAFRNLDRARAKGVEFELERKSESGFSARFGYSIQKAEDTATGDELSNSPRHLLTLSLIAPVFKDKLFTGLELQYRGIARTLSREEAGDFVLMNLTVFSQKLIKNLEASASVYNLLGTRYVHPGSQDHLQDVIMQNGRQFRVKLTYRF